MKQSVQMQTNKGIEMVSQARRLLYYRTKWDTSTRGDIRAEVVNAHGQVVQDFSMQFTNYAKQLHMGKLQSGIYLLHITNAHGKMFNLKFIVK